MNELNGFKGSGMEYIAYVCKGQNAEYGVRFPDLPGCMTTGRTLEEARERAIDALTLHVAQMMERGETVPEPSTLDELATDDGMRGGVAVLVCAEAPEKTVRVNITARASQIEAIDRLARMAGMTRSAFLVQTAIREGGVVGRRMAAD
jgi:predicted RNase H-like HicB family nuclease